MQPPPLPPKQFLGFASWVWAVFALLVLATALVAIFDPSPAYSSRAAVASAEPAETDWAVGAHLYRLPGGKHEGRILEVGQWHGEPAIQVVHNDGHIGWKVMPAARKMWEVVPN